MKTRIFLALLIALSACKREEPEPVLPVSELDTVAPKPIPEAPETNLDVIPGEKIGNIELEMNPEKLAFLGEPDLSDSAMGKSWMTWYSERSGAVSGKSELNVFTSYKDMELKEKVVRLIRVTSADFHLDSISAGKKLPEILEKFPDAKNVGDYAFGKTKDIVLIYDDQEKGVAFEVLRDSCIALIVHPKGKDVTLDYRTFRPDMTLK